MVTTEEMQIDVCTVAETHSASLQTIGASDDSVLIVSSSGGDHVAAFIVFSEDMQTIMGGVFADGQGHEIRVAANTSTLTMGDLEVCYTNHHFMVKNISKGSVALSVSNDSGHISIVGAAGNREDFQTTVLQDFKDLHLEYSVKDGSVSKCELTVLPMDAK
jgi:tryptophan synthase beta subunit